MVLGVKGLGYEPINVTVFFIRNCFRFFYYFLLAFNTDYTTLGRFTCSFPFSRTQFCIGMLNLLFNKN